MQKPSRVQNKAILSSFHNKRCLVCGVPSCDPAHIKTKGSGGRDEENNLMPLCREHHSQQHLIGISTFSEKYESVSEYLECHGWKVVNLFGVKKVVRND